MCIDCNRKTNNNFLKGTKWLTKEIKIDSQNTLKDFEIKAISMVDSNSKLFSQYGDSIVITWVEGKIPDTSNYKLVDNKIIYYRPNIDTDIHVILKHSGDSLETRSLQGVIIRAIKLNN
jgi:hypothetical protein